MRESTGCPFRLWRANQAPHRRVADAIEDLGVTVTQLGIVHYRIRYDRVDTDGHVSIRRAGRMHHLGIGRRHTGKRILAITDETTVTVTHLDTGEILSEHHIDPARGYWRNQLQPPGRRPQK